MSARGFSLVELLVALALCAVVSAALAGVVAPARAAFETAPAAIDQHLRARSGADTIVSALRAAGLDSSAPAVLPEAEPGGDDFSSLAVLVGDGEARGELAADQSGPSGPLALDAGEACPAAGDVCGFVAGSRAVILDGHGRFDVVDVASTVPSRLELVPAAPLSVAYRAGSTLVEADLLRFEAPRQADGSRTLVRVTSAGAAQPIVEGVTAFAIDAWAASPPPAIDALQPIAVADASDGPWCAGGVQVPLYDADLLRIRQVDVVLSLEVLSAALRGPAGVLFGRPGDGAHASPRWVPDRHVRVSVALRHQR